jgi:hypothetical protein
MKPAVWFCAAVATALAAAILYWYGISLFSVLVALILLDEFASFTANQTRG